MKKYIQALLACLLIMSLSVNAAIIQTKSGFTQCSPANSNGFYIFDWKNGVIIHDGNTAEKIKYMRQVGVHSWMYITEERKSEYGDSLVHYVFTSTPIGDFLTIENFPANMFSSMNWRLKCNNEA